MRSFTNDDTNWTTSASGMLVARPPSGRLSVRRLGTDGSAKLALLLRIAVYARNSAAWSVAHSRNVRGGAPVSSENVDVTNAG